jgi:ankyrin repeat protein
MRGAAFAGRTVRQRCITNGYAFACGASAAQDDARSLNMQLAAALRGADTAQIEQLVERGADVNSRNRVGDTLLIVAARTGNARLARFALEHRARASLANTAGTTPLMEAAFNGHEAIAGELLGHGVDVEALDRNGRGALIYAAGAGHAGIVRRLLTAGARVDARGANELTALMWAAGQGHLPVVRVLLEAGADPRLVDDRGKTAGQIAAEQAQAEIAALLSAR